MRRIGEKIIRLSSRRFASESPTPLEDEDIQPQQPKVLLPEDLLVLQQEFSEQFSCLQEEVRSDLSRAHLNVGLKLRTYGELLLARQQALLEKMIIKPPGVAPTTLFDARHDLARYDRPIFTVPASAPPSPANQFPFEHLRKPAPFPEGSPTHMNGSPTHINGQNGLAARKLHSTRFQDQDEFVTVNTQFEDRISKRFSGANHEADLMPKKGLSTRIQEKLSTHLSEESDEDDAMTKQERYSQFLQEDSKRSVRFHDRGPSARRERPSQARVSDLFGDDVAKQLRLSDREENPVTKKDASAQTSLPDVRHEDDFVTKRERSSQTRLSDHKGNDVTKHLHLSDHEGDPVTKKDASAQLRCSNLNPEDDWIQDKDSTCHPDVIHNDDLVIKNNRSTWFREKFSIHPPDMNTDDHSQVRNGSKERTANLQERESTRATDTNHAEDDPVPEKKTSVQSQAKVSTSSAPGMHHEDMHHEDEDDHNDNPPVQRMKGTVGTRSTEFVDKSKRFDSYSAVGSMFGRDSELEKFSEQSSIKSTRFGKIEQSRWFDAVCAGILIINALFIGIQVEAQSESGKTSPFFTVCDVLFTLLFVGELVIRIGAAGSLYVYFTKQGDWSWNWFDFLITSFAVLETLFALAGKDGLATLRVVRVLRVLRMIRVVRIIRVMRFFRSLRILISAILGTMKSGVWTAMLLIMIIYLFALVFAQAAVDHLVNLPSETEMTDEQIAEKQVLWKYFGTLPRSIFTLWKAIVGGMDWEAATQVLSDVSGFYVAVFNFYVALLYLAVLNVVAGLFLQTAVEQAASDMNDVAHEVRTQRQWYISLIKEIFNHADASADGIISLSEFEDVMADDKMRDFLDLLGLQVSDAWTLFKLLDSGGVHGIEADDFVEGCLRLRGQARSLDIAQLMYESKWMRDELFEIHNYLRVQFEGGRGTVAAVKREAKVETKIHDMALDLVD